MTLKLVSPGGSGKQPGRTSNKRTRTGADLKRKLKAAYKLDAADIALLNETADAVDRVEAIARQIKRDGLMVRGRSGSRPHPLIRFELQMRQLVSRNLQRLG